MACLEQAIISRRALLGAAGGLFAWSFIPKSAFAADGRDYRFITVVLRGALDGLSAVPPLADPGYVAARSEIALTPDGPDPAIDLDGFFALHPAMPNLGKMFHAGEASIAHAVSTNYRGRSHFDGQDVLESGRPGPGDASSGWLNRAIGIIPPGEAIPHQRILGVGSEAPLIVRGDAPVVGWAPTFLAQADDDTQTRLLDLYRHQDPFLAEAFAAGLETEALAMSDGAGMRNTGAQLRSAASMTDVASGTARLVAADDGPRIAAVAFNGWDTHANEGGAKGRLASLLSKLDNVLGTMQGDLGEKWKDTVILVVTEFGRTVEVNGTDGTDHGTGTVALLAGGAVNGGKILADWPGLAPRNLYEGRDLNPTVDLRSIEKGLLADLFGLSDRQLAGEVFPESADVPPLRDLVT